MIYTFSAAAPISQEVLEYFMSLDIRIWEIYGMSEIRYTFISCYILPIFLISGEALECIMCNVHSVFMV